MESGSFFTAFFNIREPWKIIDIQVIDSDRRLEVFIGRRQAGKWQSFFSKKPKTKRYRWQDTSLGEFAVYLNLVLEQGASVGREDWMPKPGAHCSFRMLQRLHHFRDIAGSSQKLYADFFHLNDESIRSLSLDVRPNDKVGGLTDATCKALIYQQHPIDIKSLPLKLLLARIRLQSKRPDFDAKTATSELKAFFERCAKLLAHEISQLNKLSESDK